MVGNWRIGELENSFTFLEAANWKDYALLDSGDGLKLERFGKCVFARPESQAMWKRALTSEWKNADAVFISTGEESGGHWDFKRKVEERWEMRYELDFSLTPVPSPLRSASGDTSPTGRGGLYGVAKTKMDLHSGRISRGSARWARARSVAR